MTIADNLQTLIDCKADMKAAIEERGVTVSGGLSTYADAIRSIEGESIESAFICEEGFRYSSSKKEDFGVFDFTYIIDGSYMFSDYSGWDMGASPDNLMTKIKIVNANNCSNMQYIFKDCRYLTTVDMDDTSNVIDMMGMFLACYELTDFPNIDTRSVTNMMGMCESCIKLKNVDNLNTSKAKDMRLTFYNCKKLEKLPFMDFTNVVNVQEFLGNNTTITTLGGFKNLGAASGFLGSNKGFLDGCANLTYTSIMNVINNLAKPRGENELKLHTNVLAKLSNSDIAIATNKGWVITV